MPVFVMIPVADLAAMKPTHTHVLAGLQSFANEAGICWPGLRRLAIRCGMTLSRVQRIVAEMEVLGYLTRVKRGAGRIYRLAARFVQRQRPASGNERPTSGTKLESGRRLKVKGDPVSVRRAAPPPSDAPRRGNDQPPVLRTARKTPPATKTGIPVFNPPTERPARPAEGPNPFARRQWLKTLNTFIGERLNGSLQWAGWEVVTKALNGDSLAPVEKRRLDGLDRMMRGCGYRAGGG